MERVKRGSEMCGVIRVNKNRSRVIGKEDRKSGVRVGKKGEVMGVIT